MPGAPSVRSAIRWARDGAARGSAVRLQAAVMGDARAPRLPRSARSIAPLRDVAIVSVSSVKTRRALWTACRASRSRRSRRVGLVRSASTATTTDVTAGAAPPTSTAKTPGRTYVAALRTLSAPRVAGNACRPPSGRASTPTTKTACATASAARASTPIAPTRARPATPATTPRRTPSARSLRRARAGARPSRLRRRWASRRLRGRDGVGDRRRLLSPHHRHDARRRRGARWLVSVHPDATREDLLSVARALVGERGDHFARGFVIRSFPDLAPHFLPKRRFFTLRT